MTTPRLSDTILATTARKRPLALPGGRSIPMVCDRPFDDAATELLRSAIRGDKPVPTVLNRRRMPVPALA